MKFAGYACHPLVANGRLLGTLSFGSRRESVFTPELMGTVRALTDMVAEAIARKQVDDALAASAAEFKLPLRTGLEVLAWIRQQPALRTLIVIVLSSSINEGDVRRAYELGANAFLVKPSDANSLAEMSEALKHFWLTHNQPQLSVPR